MAIYSLENPSTGHKKPAHHEAALDYWLYTRHIVNKLTLLDLAIMHYSVGPYLNFKKDETVSEINALSQRKCIFKILLW